MTPGEMLRELRGRKPLIHQITNYVVMNETANATLAIGALPVMAHAPEEVEEMASVAGALVLNIGTLSSHWIDAMAAAGKAANRDPLLAAITGSGCMSSALTGCFVAVDASVDGAAAALAAFGVAGEDAARDAKGPGTFHANLYDALYGLQPEMLDERARIEEV